MHKNQGLTSRVVHRPWRTSMNTPAIDANEIPFYNPKGENTSDYAVFKRVPWGDGDKYPMQINPAVGDEIRQVVLDVETTGLLPNGVVIEVRHGRCTTRDVSPWSFEIHSST